jgi:glycosyltransferase involved in cell wall biosynthesis
MKVLRIYHGGRNAAHRARERALVDAGVELMLVVPETWTLGGPEPHLSAETFPIRELSMRRSDDMNRHAYRSSGEIAHVLAEWEPEIVDIHEEPFSVASHQWLGALATGIPVVMYTAQNVDKRLPPPFDRFERKSLRRATGVYPCTRQAASVARGKGYTGLLEVIPLGVDPTIFRPGDQSLDDDVLTLALFGRLVPQKGVRDAVVVLKRLNEVRHTRLLLVGSGTEERSSKHFAESLGVGDRVQVKPWTAIEEVAEAYRRAHVVLVPSVPTATWTEQFGRVIVEGQASGAVVVGYATGSIPEVGGDAAVLERSGDTHGLADAIVRLVGERAEFNERRLRGIEASQERTWTRVAEEQVALYERAIAPSSTFRSLPESPRRRRALARAEFGPTAPTTAGYRPFALPLLRRGGPLPEALGALIDAGAEVKAALRSRSGA